VLFAVCFTYCLPFSEVAFVKLEDIRLDSAGLHFKVKKAKNHRLGFNVCLPVERKRRYCVGAFVLDYLEGSQVGARRFGVTLLQGGRCGVPPQDSHELFHVAFVLQGFYSVGFQPIQQNVVLLLRPARQGVQMLR
jgi:hypothetical protein